MAAKKRSVDEYLAKVSAKIHTAFPRAELDIFKRKPYDTPAFRPESYFITVLNVSDEEWSKIEDEIAEVTVDALLETGYSIHVSPTPHRRPASAETKA